MWELLKETAREISDRRLNLLKVFWPILLYLTVVGALIVAAFSIADYVPSVLDDDPSMVEILALVLCMFLMIAGSVAVIVAPSAVNWHRMILLGEIPTWRLRILPRTSLRYGGLLTLFLTFSFIVILLSKLVWGTIIWFLLAGEGDYFLSPIVWTRFTSELPSPHDRLLAFAGPTIGKLAIIVVYVLAIGRWFLLLPRTALDLSDKLVARPLQRRQLLAALIAVYSVPTVVEGLEYYAQIRMKVAWDYEPFWTTFIVAFVGVASSIVALTLLTVAYRRNIRATSHVQESSR